MTLDKDDFLGQAVDIDSLRIDEHFRRVPAELAYYNQQYADSVERHLRAKQENDLSHARAYFRTIEVEAGGKKPTVAEINAAIELDDEYRAAREELIQAESEKQRIRGKVEVISAKKEMLISLGAHMRAELSNPAMRVLDNMSKPVEY